MDNQLPIELALPAVRQALFELQIDLTLAIHDGIHLGKHAKLNANLVHVCGGVLIGHAQQHPMTATEISERIRMPRGSVIERLNRLISLGVVERIDDVYLIEPQRAAHPPTHDCAIKILKRACVVLGPYLASKSDASKSDTD